MSDLVERLRTASSLAQALPACREAADRIEQLEAALRDILAEVGTSTRANKIAQFALHDGTGQDK